MELEGCQKSLAVFFFFSKICKGLMAVEIDGSYLNGYRELINHALGLYENVFAGSTAQADLSFHSLHHFVDMIERVDPLRPFWNLGQEGASQWMMGAVKNSQSLFLSIQNLLVRYHVFSWLLPPVFNFKVGEKKLETAQTLDAKLQKNVVTACARHLRKATSSVKISTAEIRAQMSTRRVESNAGAILQMESRGGRSPLLFIQAVAFVTCTLRDRQYGLVAGYKRRGNAVECVRAPAPAPTHAEMEEGDRGEYYDGLGGCFFFVGEMPLEKNLAVFNTDRLSHEVFAVRGAERADNQTATYLVDGRTAFVLGDSVGFDKPVAMVQEEEEEEEDVNVGVRKIMKRNGF